MATTVKGAPVPIEIASALATLRADIVTLTAEIDAITRAPVPYHEAARQLTARLDELAAGYAPGPMLRTFLHDPDVTLETVASLLPDPRWAHDQQRACLAALHRDRLLELWLEQLTRQYDTLDEPVIPLADRAAKIAALRERLRAVRSTRSG